MHQSPRKVFVSHVLTTIHDLLRPNHLLDAVSSSPDPTLGHSGYCSQGYCWPSRLLTSPVSCHQSASRTRGTTAMPDSSLSPSMPPPGSGQEASLTTPLSGSCTLSGPSQLCPLHITPETFPGVQNPSPSPPKRLEPCVRARGNTRQSLPLYLPLYLP